MTGIFDKSEDLLLHIENHQTDIILSDIFTKNLPTGIELLKKLKFVNIPIVLVTQSQDREVYAEALRHRKVHYLIKPFHQLSLQSTLEMALNEHFTSKHHNFSDKKFLYLSGKAGQREQVFFYEIVYVEADDNYIFIYTTTKKYIQRISLNKFLSESLDENFVRIHHKYAIHKMHLKKTDGDVLHLTGKVELPIGKSYKKGITEMLKKTFQM